MRRLEPSFSSISWSNLTLASRLLLLSLPRCIVESHVCQTIWAYSAQTGRQCFFPLSRIVMWRALATARFFQCALPGVWSFRFLLLALGLLGVAAYIPNAFNTAHC